MDEIVGMVLCAGLGTRLRPLTEHVPKPAVPVANLPLVRWSLALLRGAGVRRAVVNVHHLPGVMEREARAAAAALGMELAVSREPVIAGTGGALREARPLLAGAEAVLLVNGDVLFDVDLRAALASHLGSGALATMVLLPMPAGARYAAVEVDAAGAVRRIAGTFGPGGDGLTPRHFSGVHVLSPAVLDRVPATPIEVDVRDVYAGLMGEGLLRGHLVDGYWNDLGAPDRYLAAHADLLAGRVPLDPFDGLEPFGGLEERGAGIRAARSARIDPAAALTGPVLLGDGAVVEAGARVGPDAVVGARCRVAAGAEVREAVLWEGTVLAPGERIEGAIAAGSVRLPA
ncbi:MAG TPA: NDP-sugar synthase [Anaeromyxobacteraceae bacterium]|nr:NDP-sugar synthase [Anaeromyxobacteraceae bacterium]